MARTSDTTQSAREQRLAQIKSALAEATLRFPASRANELVLGPAQLQEAVAAEVAFGKVSVDETGLTAGMQMHLLQPARGFMHQWWQARGQFDLAIEPVMKDIDAVAALEQDVVAETKRRDDERARIERQLESGQEYMQIRHKFDVAEQRWKGKSEEHGGREANMFGYTKRYLVLIFLIGGAEWLINYDTFFLFTGIPAIAAGATLILGFLLAFAAHGFGLILKQWSFRFGRHRDHRERFSDWRLLGLSFTSLLVVLIAAGGSRYAAALNSMASETQSNILGPDVVVAVDPLRDVLISLLANLGAWLLGVFISYVSHDADPVYMDASLQYERNRRTYLRARRDCDRQLETLEAKFQKTVGETTTAAQTRAKAVEQERGLLAQMKTHETAVMAALRGVLGANLETYRDLLAKAALSQKGVVFIARGAGSGVEAYTPFEFKSLKLPINDIVQSLAA